MITFMHTDALVASSTSVLATAALVTGAAPVPADVPQWLPYIITITGPAALFALRRVLAAIAAGRRARAKVKADRAAALRADANPANDTEAAALEEEAAGLKAEAAALENLSPPAPSE